MRALRKVLVVDDDPVVGKSFDRVLSEKGYEVSTALSGPEALKKLGEEDYDVVFTDIRMPGMDGIEVAERVRSKRPWIPVVIVTGYGTAANEARAKEAGVSGFLRKPLSPEMIEGSARDALLRKEPSAVPEKAIEPVTEPAPAAAETERARGGALHVLKNIALFFAAPFVGLAYVIAFPVIGLGMAAWWGLRALAKRSRNIALVVKHVVMFFAAPFIGLLYVLTFPFVMIAMLVWQGARALVKRSESG